MAERPAKGKLRLRCAVYTRKSSEEGLEQEFNSLDAQREACEAFIASQWHEAWTLLRDPTMMAAYRAARWNGPRFSGS